jgi:hypothetical protein
MPLDVRTSQVTLLCGNPIGECVFSFPAGRARVPVEVLSSQTVNQGCISGCGMAEACRSKLVDDTPRWCHWSITFLVAC